MEKEEAFDLLSKLAQGLKENPPVISSESPMDEDFKKVKDELEEDKKILSKYESALKVVKELLKEEKERIDEGEWNMAEKRNNMNAEENLDRLIEKLKELELGPFAYALYKRREEALQFTKSFRLKLNKNRYYSGRHWVKYSSNITFKVGEKEYGFSYEIDFEDDDGCGNEYSSSSSNGWGEGEEERKTDVFGALGHGFSAMHMGFERYYNCNKPTKDLFISEMIKLLDDEDVLDGLQDDLECSDFQRNNECGEEGENIKGEEEKEEHSLQENPTKKRKIMTTEEEEGMGNVD
mmetsp:Transcript_6770/g.10255  ORF Transcript_6770/g.10255 Transcript_6770/m.10255 type:complete len:293 (-) Transcript_6770:106-984(-)|eukprot:CAMPEP_0201534280 /NCGR_PEP_ID=MMETSP0161_2-20130828/55812_1 /ASSEMBLY_ACC=CAM_ASM_000251 /TAXON_ID=180227 /ORGANISM="Neoparamoeba aestuarina, Strain SoJaBio B1-5/56/2" /LENGTH=292 /DNA_ID=CAMNT_0047938825 /DNA_START=60 /DNA_END=938 /DNA_ORIENTATION=+